MRVSAEVKERAVRLVLLNNLSYASAARVVGISSDTLVTALKVAGLYKPSALKKWDSEADSQLVRMAGKGFSAGLIARHMGLRRNQVVGRMRQLCVKRSVPHINLPNPRHYNLHKDEDSEIRALFLSGRSDAVIASELNRPIRSIEYRRLFLGLSRRAMKSVCFWADEHDRILRKMYHAGYSDDEIGAQLNRSRNSIIGRRYRIGVFRRKPRKSRSKAASLDCLSYDYRAKREELIANLR